MLRIHSMAPWFHRQSEGAADNRHFILQKLLVEKHYPGFKCSLRRGILECVGSIQPSDLSPKYRIRIRCKLNGIPSVRVLEPGIAPKSPIHMYRNGDLCLYHPGIQPWRKQENIHASIIPWTAEWLVFYELYLSEGKWLGPEIPHGELPSTAN